MAEVKTKNRIYIVGAGFAGTSLAAEISKKGIYGKVVAFLDDDPAKIGKTIDSIPVTGPIRQASAYLKAGKYDEAIIAIPSCTPAKLKEIFACLKEAGFTRIRILPSLSQIIDGNAHMIQTKDIEAEDLLDRKPVVIPLKESLSYLRQKRVVITGAGGSIGSELCRQLLSGGAQRLFLFGHGENSIYEIEKELRLLQSEGVGEKATIVPVIGELQDPQYLDFIMDRLKPDVIFHCAAHKHVPLMEANPVAAVRNNVFGTQNLLSAAKKSGCKKFILISTDKAVEPNSIYGTSKLVAEELVLSASTEHFSCMVVRFGNVLGSRGSIIPLFKKQILTGGPVTITHKDTTRFFMTIPEAASLVLKTGGVGEAGKLYLLDMGEPVNIHELACSLIRFYGFQPYTDIPIVITGLRSGERLHEQLYSRDDIVSPTVHEGILNVERANGSKIKLTELLEALSKIVRFSPEAQNQYMNRIALRETLKTFVPTLGDLPGEPEY